MLTEYCNKGNLLQEQSKMPNHVFTKNRAIEICVDLLKGLEYLHCEGYLHRDLKPTNILVNNENGKDVNLIISRSLNSVISGL